MSKPLPGTRPIGPYESQLNLQLDHIDDQLSLFDDLRITRKHQVTDDYGLEFPYVYR